MMPSSVIEEIRDRYFGYFDYLSDDDIEYLVSLLGYDKSKRRCSRCNYTGWHVFESKGINNATKCECVELLKREGHGYNVKNEVRKSSDRPFSFHKRAGREE